MSNFRAQMYERYVSTFKGDPTGSGTDEAIHAWLSRKYGPLLDGIDTKNPVLELGCGPGDMLEFLKRRGFEKVRGIDISEEQVRIARARDLDAVTADVFEALEGDKGRYGTILALDFFEHFSKEELMRLLPLIHGALRSDGILVLQTPNGQGLFPHQIIYGDLTHMTIFTPESLAQILRLTGFGDFKFVESGPVAKNLTGFLRLVAWRCIRVTANLLRLIETGKRQEIWTENVICRCRRV